MKKLPFQDPMWCHALTLRERLKSLPLIQPEALNIGVNRDLAERRMQRWRSQPPFSTGSYFSQRLASDNMSEDELLYLLGEPIEAVCDRFASPLTWVSELASAFARPDSSKPTAFPEAL